MNYMDRLKQIDGEKNSYDTPGAILTKPPKAPSVSFVSTDMGYIDKKINVATVTVANPPMANVPVRVFGPIRAPVVVCGRTFRTCRACGRMGWHPQATAEICCGSAMQMIEQPALTVAEYVNFIGCPKAYATGAITRGDVLDMMRRDHINPLPGLENVAAAIL